MATRKASTAAKAPPAETKADAPPLARDEMRSVPFSAPDAPAKRYRAQTLIRHDGRLYTVGAILNTLDTAQATALLAVGAVTEITEG
jgi:hypothetical protein